MKKKLLYISNIRLPTERAHGIQIMKMCEAFAKVGFDVELVVPKRKNPIVSDPFEYYKVERSFAIKKIPCVQAVYPGKIGFWFQTIVFSTMCWFYVLFNKPDVVYTRDELPGFYMIFLKFLSLQIVWESHMVRWNFFGRALSKFSKIVVISNGLNSFYKSKGILKENILLAPDGVDIDQFDLPINKGEARRTLSLSQNKSIVMYTGHLYDWKGATTLAEAASYFDTNTEFMFVGGTDKHISEFKERYKNVRNLTVVGRVAHTAVPLYLKAADVLVLPNSAKEDISRLYTSPMKLFEYMASSKPIVASRIPSLCEILNTENAIFATPDDPASFSNVIERLLKDKSFQDQLATRARIDVNKYSWDVRAESIENFIKN